MKKLIALYFIVFAFGMGFGTWKNHTWDFSEWGYHSSTWVTVWWIVMGTAATAFCLLPYIARVWNRIIEEERQRTEARK